MIYVAVVVAVLLALAFVAAAFLGLARLRGWRIGKLSWPFGRDHGACHRCTTTFLFVLPHWTPYDITDRGTRLGMNPLCEGCWRELGSPEARYPFYAAMLTQQIEAYETRGLSDAAEGVRRVGFNVAAALRSGL